MFGDAIVNSFGDTPLHLCRTVDETKALVATGADVRARTNYGLTPLHRACMAGCLESALVLIEAGADIKAKDTAGVTSLHEACRSGHLELAQTLVAAGADMNAKSVIGETPLDWACNYIKLVLLGAYGSSLDSASG